MQMLAVMLGGGELVILLPLLLVGCLALPLTVFWIWMLIDCLTKESDQGNTKVAWVLVIALTHWLGALIYLLARRPQRIKELGK
jgi:hypothetical protein